MKPGEASKMWVKQYIQIEGQQNRQNGYRAPAAARRNVWFREGACLGDFAQSMPESAKALWRMVSLTAAKTSRMFEVSVAWVRL